MPSTGNNEGSGFPLEAVGEAHVRLRRLVTAKCEHHDVYMDTGIQALCSGLLTGLSGIGKRTLVAALCQALDLSLITVSSASLSLSRRAQAYAFDDIFAQAIDRRRCVVCIEEVQTVFPARNTTDEMYLAFTSSLQRIRDADNGVLLLATCSDSSSLHPEVLKRFEENIPLELPTLPHRLALLHYLTSSSHPTPLNLHPIAERSQAFRLADLAELCDSALRHAFSRQGDGYGSSVTLVQEDFDAAFGAVEIKASEGGRYEGAKVEVVRWADVGGHAKAKTLLKESVVWSFKNIDAFKRLGIAPSKGVLLHGPPGTGKTLLAKAVATESGANFMPISIPELIKGEVGESEKAITRTFTLARRTSPTIIFIDELEALFSRHENMGDAGKKLFSMLVVEIDALEAGSGVVLLCATNYPGLVEKALLRPGRIDRLISIPPPTHRDRLSILQTLTKRLTLAPDVDLAVLARRMKGATGADLKEVVRRASLAAIAREGFQNKPVVQMADFQAKEVRAYGGGGVAS